MVWKIPFLLQADKIYPQADYFKKAEDFKAAMGETTKGKSAPTKCLKRLSTSCTGLSQMSGLTLQLSKLSKISKLSQLSKFPKIDSATAWLL